MIDIDLPVTSDGNDPADYDQPTLDNLNRQIDTQHQQERLARGLTPSAGELDRMVQYLDLFREFEARTGRKLTCIKSITHRDDCISALRLAGRL